MKCLPKREIQNLWHILMLACKQCVDMIYQNVKKLSKHFLDRE